VQSGVRSDEIEASVVRPLTRGSATGLVRRRAPRPGARARFLELDGEKGYVRGVTYGTFRDRGDGFPYPDRELVEQDFAAIAATGANAVRLYTAPPRWMLDLAYEHGLKAMIDLAWETHVAFLDDRETARRIVDRVEREVASCAGHPAVLCYAVGNEIPASIVRWHGGRGVERFIERLCAAVKNVDPGGLVTYVNYPSTEYLRLPSLDLVSFNVYLESDETLASYLARLHNIAGDRPLLITELGLDSRRHGLDLQAEAVERQLRTTFASGCAGAFVFAWTDEWHRGGVDVDDWQFGLVDRNRQPKPALAAVERVFADVSPADDAETPRISVVVCSYNGETTIGRCLEALERLDYPDYEVIVVDDGSTDRTSEIASRFDFRLIRTDNRGLSCARNTGIEAATGEIVAFTDDDAWPDPDWLRHLAHAFASGDHAGIGGPNLAPDDAGLVENAVAHAPGGPVHVLVTDEIAEHIPGCNMAFRRDALEAVGGFDPQFKVAGDDVDVCWRLQEEGRTIGFAPGAVVLHRRRRTIRAYLGQQAAYGKAEALLERKWPHRYNRRGHVAWSGTVYGAPSRRRGRRIGYGTWGSNLFQSLYERGPGSLRSLPLLPEWHLLLAALATLSILGLFQPLVPWAEDLPVPVEQLLLLGAAAILLVEAFRTGIRALNRSLAGGLALRGLTIVLVVLQPAARLMGRLRYGLTPWRRRGTLVLAVPRPRRRQLWSESWRSPNERLLELERDLRSRSATVVRGGEFDRWDLQVRLGPLATSRVRMAVEEHGNGCQLIRYRIWPRWSRAVPPLLALLGLWLAGSVARHLYLGGAVAGVLCLLLVVRALLDAAAAIAVVEDAVTGRLEAEYRSDDLLEDLRVVSVHSLTRAGGWDEKAGLPVPAEAAWRARAQ
jgi:O-antigen biosynthesis protein